MCNQHLPVFAVSHELQNGNTGTRNRFLQQMAVLFNLSSTPKEDFKPMKASDEELLAVFGCIFSACSCLIPPILQHSHLLFRSSLFFRIFTVSWAKVSFISCVPAIQRTPVPAALRGISGTVQSSWICSFCQEYSSGAVVRILTNQRWISSRYLHSK